MSSSNCCFLTCIQISQETGKVVWYSHLFKNFPQFVVIHTVKGFTIVNEGEVEVFLEFPCFFYDPVDVGNFVSASSAFSKCILNIWKHMVQSLSCIQLFVTLWTVAHESERVPEKYLLLLYWLHQSLWMKCSLGISKFLEEISSLSHSIFSSISLHWSLRRAFLSLLAIRWNSALRWVYISFSPLPFTSLFSAICKASSDNHFAFLHFFFLGKVLIPAYGTMSRTSVFSSSGTLSIRSNPFNLFVTSTV